MIELKFLKSLGSKEGRKALLKGEGLQGVYLISLRDQNTMVVPLDKIETAIIEYKGSRFYLEVPNYSYIFSVYNDWPFDKLRFTDVVLDIGANIGAFSIPASRLVSSVYAVEPVTYDLLIKNIKLNIVTKLHTIQAGLGRISGPSGSFKWAGSEVRSRSFSLSGLKGYIGKDIDFLKIDCEGDEWWIDPEEFRGIRVISGECHIWTSRQREMSRWKEWLDWFTGNGYSVSIRQSYKYEWKFIAESLKGMAWQS
jgi:FkbM family methyltransferase